MNWNPLPYEVGDEDADEESTYFPGGYDVIVSSFGYEVLLSESFGDYQGDIYYLLRDGDKYGFLIVGYGSCSGCDALQSCDTRREIEELREQTHGSIRWFEADEICDGLLAHDWLGNWYGGETVKFLRKSFDVLGKPLYSPELTLLLNNPETPAYVIADAAQECGMVKVAEGLRDECYSDDVLKNLREKW